MLWQHLLNRPVASRLHEDNESAIKIIRSGYSTALRHIVKTQRVSIASLHEHFSDPLNTLVYCPTLEQRADFLTKPLDRIKLHCALDMIGLRINCDKSATTSSSVPSPHSVREPAKASARPSELAQSSR
jgi:hypothetical protein